MTAGGSNGNGPSSDAPLDSKAVCELDIELSNGVSDPEPLRQGSGGTPEELIVIGPAQPDQQFTDGYIRVLHRDGDGNVYVLGDTSLSDPFFYRRTGVISKFDPNLVWLGEILPRLELAEYDTCMFLETTCRLRETEAFVTQDFVLGGDGSIYVAAVAQADLANLTSFGSDDALVGKLSPAGEFVWVDRFGSDGLDTASIIRLHPDGGVLVSGQDLSLSEGRFYLTKYDSNGRRLWTRGTEDPVNYADRPQDIVVDPEGRIYLLYRYAIFVFDPDGGIERTILPQAFEAVAMGFAPDGIGYATTQPRGGLASFTGCGPVLWHRLGLEPVSVESTGFGYGTRERRAAYSFALGSAALFRGGEQEGSLIPAEYEAVEEYTGAVSKYDLSGERLWYRQLVLELAPGLVPQQGWTVATLELTGEEDVIAALNGRMGQTRYWTVVKLAGGDGSLQRVADYGPAETTP